MKFLLKLSLLLFVTFAYGESYKVVKIRSDDTLSVRSDAGIHNRKIDELYYRTKNIKVIRCKYTPRGKRWCKVQHPSIYTGWVSARYITPQYRSSDREPIGKRYRVVKIRSDDTLSVRSNAGIHNRKIDDLYYRTKNIKVIRCKYTPRGKRWCKVQHPSIYSGWVSAK